MELLKKYLIWFVFFLSFLLMAKVVFQSSYPDFRAHYYGAKLLLSTGNPYVESTDYFTSQVYPPIDFLFVSPLTVVPFITAQKVWILLSIASVISSLYLLLRMVNISMTSQLGLVISSLAFLAFPTRFTLGMGQINAVLLLLLSLGLYYLLLKKELLAALLLAVIMHIKFFPLLLIPYFVIKKRFKLISLIIVISVIFSLFVVTFGYFDALKHFYASIVPSIFGSWKYDYYNQALSGLIARHFAAQELRTVVLYVLTILFIFISFVILWKSRKIQSKDILLLEISFVIILNLLINGFSWQHHFIFLIPSFIFILSYIHKQKASWFVVLLLLCAYIFVAINLKYPHQWPVLLQSHVFFGALLLWGLNGYLLLNKYD